MACMTNKQRQEWLRAARIFNEHGLADAAEMATGNPGVFIGYRTQESGRAFNPAAWQVIRPSYKTDPHGYWRDYGHKTFLVNGREDKEAQRDRAIRWASHRYGFDANDWVPSPYGRGQSWFPRTVLEAAYTAVEAGAYFDKERGAYVPPPDGQY